MRGIACLLIMLTPALPADFTAGLRAYEAKDFVTAAKEWRPLAEQGDARSQFNLALLYLDGKGVPQSDLEAVELFRRAADQGYTRAQYNLGSMYASGQGTKRNYVQAHMWLNICAATGDEKCAAMRDQVAQKMKTKELNEAKRLAVEWKPASK